MKRRRGAKTEPRCRFGGYPGRYIRGRDRYQNPVVPSALHSPVSRLDAVSIRGGTETAGAGGTGTREKENQEREGDSWWRTTPGERAARGQV